MLRPGCFQSALAAQGTSPACVGCPDRPDCFAGVLDCSPALLDRINAKMTGRGYDADDRAPVLARVGDYLDRLKNPVRETPLRNMDRVAGLKLKVKEAGIDLSAIKAGLNPFQPSDAMNYQMTAFVLEGVPFKPKDMAEHLSETVSTDRKQSSLASEVSRFVSLLVEEGILCRKERNIICLA